jgi:DNA-binding transcriptional ArsR family regulator
METRPQILHTLNSIQASLPMKSAYTLDEMARATGRSKPTAYRYLAELEKNGFVITLNKGAFSLRDSVFLPITIIPQIIPSLQAFKRARRFRLRNGKSGIAKARGLLGKVEGMSTLDYAAYDFTGYQTPETFYFYPNSFDMALNVLRENHYVESPKGKVVLLPRVGDFSEPILRVFYDSLALGGRGILDAIAISRKYPEITKSSGYLDHLLNLARKVAEDTRGVGRIGPNTR